jgi:hypothetical protein
MIDRPLTEAEARAELTRMKAELESAWQERKRYLDHSKTVPTELERSYWEAVADVLYLGAHLDEHDGVPSHIPPGVAVEAHDAIQDAVRGKPSPAFLPTRERGASLRIEAYQRIAVELIVLSGFQGRPRWLELPRNFVDVVAEKFGVTRPAVVGWVRKHGSSIDGTLKREIEQRVAVGDFPTREAAAMHDLEVASSHYRAWHHDAQKRRKSTPKTRET